MFDSTRFAPVTAIPRLGEARFSWRTEIVVIDTSLTDWEILRDGVIAGAEVVLIDNSGDGLDQLAQALEGRSGIHAIHILSHGFPGGFLLGSTVLGAASLEAHRQVLTEIGASLAWDAGILLYGCGIASGTGPAFLSALADIMGADIAASHDLTGAARLGGNWDLGYRSGDIASASALTDAAMEAWPHTLIAPTISLTSNNPEFLGGSGSSGFDMFSAVAAATNDVGQTFTGAVLAVHNVGLTGEFLTIQGTDVALVDGASGALTNGIYIVSVTSGIATVTLMSMSLDDVGMSTMIDGISYKNTATIGGTSGTIHPRPVVLRTITDSGSAGDNITAVNQAATATIADGVFIPTVAISTAVTNTVPFVPGTPATVQFQFVLPALALVASTLVLSAAAPAGWTISNVVLSGPAPSTTPIGSQTLTGVLLGGTYNFQCDVLATGTDTSGAFPISLVSSLDGLALLSPIVVASSTAMVVLDTPPTLSATGDTPVIPPHSTTPVDLFSSVTAATNDPGDTFTGVELSVIPILGFTGAQEFLVIGGVDVALYDLNSVTLTGLGAAAGNANALVVEIGAGAFIVQITGLERTDAQMETLIDTVSYKNISSTTLAGFRIISIDSVTDSGGVTNAVSAVATVTVPDTTPPDMPVITSVGSGNDPTPVISGFAEADTTIILSIAGAAYLTIATGGVWSIDLGTAVPFAGALSLNLNGPNGITVTATDAAATFPPPRYRR